MLGILVCINRLLLTEINRHCFFTVKQSGNLCNKYATLRDEEKQKKQQSVVDDAKEEEEES